MRVRTLDDAERWYTLSRTVSGSWAASFYVKCGSTVELRSVSDDQEVVVSGPYV